MPADSITELVDPVLLSRASSILSQSNSPGDGGSEYSYESYYAGDGTVGDGGAVLAGARPPDPGTNSASSSPLSLEPAGFVTPARPAGGRAPAEPDEGKPCLQS